MKYQIMTSWDDGSKQDLRICQMLLEHRLPGIFYIPGNTELSPEEITEIAKNFEVGSHTIAHPSDIKLLDESDQELEIEGGIDFLARILGTRPTQFAHPRGRYDDRTIKILKKLGVTNARTTGIGFLTPGDDPYRERTTVHAFQRPEYEGVDWLEYAREKLVLWREQGGVYHLWGHGWEIDRDRNWEKLNLLMSEISTAIDTL